MIAINCLQPLSDPYWFLKKIGLWPVNRLTKSIVLKLILHLLIAIFVATMIIQNIINAIHTKDFPLFNWMTCLLPPFLNWHIKVTTLFKKRNIFFSILDDLRSTTFNIHSKELNKYIQRIDRISKMLVKYFEAFIGVYVVICCLLPFVTDIKVGLPASFNLGKYDIVYKVGHVFFTIYVGGSSVAYDALYMSLMALCVAQLNILQARLTDLVDDGKNHHLNEALDFPEDLSEDILRECLLLHKAING